MADQIVQLRVVERDESTVSLTDRLKQVIRAFEVIHEEELLAALPDCPIAFENQRAALTLLAQAEREIISIYLELQPFLGPHAEQYICSGLPR